MKPRYIDVAEEAESLRQRLSNVESVALDAEAAGFHRYSDRLSLVQLTVPGSPQHDVVLDPLALDLAPVLGSTLEDPEVDVLMHGADFDVRLFRRDLGLEIQGLFDTQVAAALLGREALGLQALVREILDVELSKEHQRADWAQRPLPPDLLQYAAEDTRHLPDLARALRHELEARGRLAWAREEFEALQQARFDSTEDQDPVVRVKGARELDPRQTERLRVALRWRDDEAQRRDRAPFRVAGDGVLLRVAVERPQTVEELADIQGMSGRLAEQSGGDLLARLDDVDDRAPEDLAPYPRPSNNGHGRQPPEVEERFRRLKEVRNAVAEDLGVQRGVLLANWVLEGLARHEPQDHEELEAVDGVRAWHAEVMGRRLLEAMDG